LLFAIYLIFDTQLVLGKGMYSYTLDDAYLASIQLYIDIMELFLHILQILAFVDNNWLIDIVIGGVVDGCIVYFWFIDQVA